MLANSLPKISWIAAPEAFSEHSNWPTNYGAWHISQVLDALTANAEVWSKTALFITYDENDGFFDHIVPPYPPASTAQGLSTIDTTADYYPGSSKYVAGPYGLGPVGHVETGTPGLSDPGIRTVRRHVSTANPARPR